MAVPKIESRGVMDEFLADHDFRAAYETTIDAPASVAYRCLLATDFNAAWIVRFLVILRTGKRIPHRQPPVDLRQQFQGSGFVILAEVPDKEIVIGVA